jgi:hypothetical protein
MEKHPVARKITDINHPMLVQVRNSSVDLTHFERLQARNGQKTLYYPRNMSFPELQHQYAETLMGDPIQDAIQRWPMASKYRRMNTTTIKDPDLPTFTHGTGWYRQAVQSSNLHYGKNRLLLDPGQYANSK